MKKYWKLLTLAVFAVIMLSIYYIQAARATNEYITMKINTISGDEALLENVTLHGYYNEAPFFLPATASLAGDVTPINGLHIHDLFRTYATSDITPYIEQYRSFMRGKTFSRLQFFEDERRLVYAELGEMDVYADMNHLSFDISSLTKESKEELNFSVTAPAKYPFRWAAIENVQIIDGMIHLVLYAATQDGSGLHHFVIDEAKQKISDYEQMAFVASNDSYYNSIVLIQSYASSENIAYYIEQYEQTEHTITNKALLQLHYYNVTTKQNTEITLPPAVQEIHYYTATKDGIYIADRLTPGKVNVHIYTYETASWHTLELEDSMSLQTIGMQVIDRHLFITAENNGLHAVHVYDAQTGELRYKGEIVNENELAKDYYFQTEFIQH